jgi:hypothetical protein
MSRSLHDDPGVGICVGMESSLPGTAAVSSRGKTQNTTHLTH